MAQTEGFFRSIRVWTHARGTLPYDIICALILLFIFLMPRSCFEARRNTAAPGGSVSKQQPVSTPSQGTK